MSTTLLARLQTAKSELGKVEAVLLKHAGAGRIPPDVVAQFSELAAFQSDVDAWHGLLAARAAARLLLTDLESQVDGSGTVPLGTARARYEHVRLIGVQAYLATKWALADRLVAMVGRILCTPNAGLNAAQPAQLVAAFINAERKKSTAASLYESIRQTFGWPIAISYALRNHFIHDGGQLSGINFFDGAAPTSAFAISLEGWKRVEERALTYGVSSGHHRAGAAWPSTPRDDLRPILDICERETDDALGILVGSACHSLAIHVGYMHGEL
jgi:hypothetical protein